MAYVATGYVATGYVVEDAPTGGYPLESDVRAGVVYGANGEYTGTATVGEFPTIYEIAAAILAAAQVTPIHADTRKINSYTVIGTGQDGDDWRAEGVQPN